MPDQVNESATMLPTNILEKLKQHKTHHPNVTCLECGYRGMMGIKSNGVRFGLGVGIALLLTIGLAVIGLYGFIWSPAIFGFGFALALNRTARPVVTCPNCDKDLII